MTNNVWNDGGQFNELLQKHMRDAIADYVTEGYIHFDLNHMAVVFYAADPLDKIKKAVGLAELIEERLRDFVEPGYDAENIDVLVYPFSDAEDKGRELLKLQQCLRILRA